MKTTLPVMLATVALAPLSTSVWAEIERQHGAHEHGAAQLSLAVDQHELVIALESPAFNVFGFEHAPSTEEQHQAIDAAVATLRDGEALWTLSRAAGCELESVEIESAVLGDDHDHDEDADHDHDHDHEAGDAHSDVDVSWHFHCDNPEKLTQVGVGLFNAFERFEDLDVQYLTDDAQGAAELSPSHTLLTLE
ncbi:DUF2796 domain-containing protein [Saccharospirillum mangrovi]|uniref:DUF2796 domain-containing protein n=1 Tax=Saccharospirillum mangrovi TaxID=2161747 RepID=UPI000D389AF5|nr:DUF2796 domain-containing protein [Saccharospirillum mangrovi]